MRGINHQLEVSKIMWQAQFWQWKRRNIKTNKEEAILVQGALRPSLWGAYEYIFPEECLSEVLSVSGIAQGVYSTTSKFQAALLRKLFPGTKKIPKKNMEEAKTIPHTMLLNSSTRGLSSLMIPGVQIIPIGIKHDNRNIWEEVGYEQEML